MKGALTSSRLGGVLSPPVVLAVCVLVAAVLPMVSGGFIVGLLTKAVLLGLFAVAVDIALGYSGLITLAPAFFFGVGAYGMAIATVDHGTSFWGGLLVAAVGALVFGVLVGWPPIRRKIGPAYFAMFTLAVGVIGFDFVSTSTEFTGGSSGKGYVVPPELFGLNFGDTTVYFYFVVFVTGLIILGMYRLLRSDYGLILHAIRQGEHRMRYLGYSTRRELFNAWLISCVVSAVCGALYVGSLGIAAPSLLSFNLTGEVLIWVVVGGVGTSVGPFFAGFALTLVEHYLGTVWPEGYLIALGVLFVAFVFLLPEGIMGLLFGRRE